MGKRIKQTSNSEMVDQREYIMSRVLNANELTKRWKMLNYNPPRGGRQLRLL